MTSKSPEETGGDKLVGKDLKERLGPITDRLKAVEVRAVEMQVIARIPFGNGEFDDYSFFSIGGTVYYTRDGKVGSFLLSEIDRINHYMAPLYTRNPIKSSLFSEISSNDIMVRLHLLLPGDSFYCTSRILFISAGAQKSMDIYTVK
jgi:hypothetical protein